LLALAAPRRPRLPQLCFLVLAAFLMTNKVWFAASTSSGWCRWPYWPAPGCGPTCCGQLAEGGLFLRHLGLPESFVYSAGGYPVVGLPGHQHRLVLRHAAGQVS